MWTIQKMIVAALTLTLMTGTTAFVAADPLIYESFDYPDDQNVAGQSGGIGWNGNWSSSWGTPKSYSDGVSWGSLITEGGRVRATGHSNLHRSFGSTLANAGLLNDGSSVWFSLTPDLRGQGIITNLEFNVALTSDPMLAGWGGDANGNERYSRMGHILNNGEGIGISQQPMNRNVNGTWTRHGQFRTAYWQDEGLNDNDAGTGPDGYGNLHESGDNGWFGITQETALLVGKIDWGVGAAGETLTLYAPGEDFASGSTIDLGTPIQTLLAPNLDQAAFDTFAIMWKDAPGLDEIRIGATMEDVLPVPTIPEPTTLSLAILGLAGAIFFGRRRKK